VTELGLGTVQLGKNYGIANDSGRPSRAEAGEILDVAVEHGVRYFDTARAYGESEAVLGDELPDGVPTRIVTKVRKVGSGAVNQEDLDAVRAAFATSLERLRTEHTYGLLVHAVDDLRRDGGERLWEMMTEWRAAGRVEAIGYSVYHPDDLEVLLPDFDPDVVQLPASAFDQRFERSGMLAELEDRGIEIHTRSAFLQGLVFVDPKELDPYFSPVCEVFERFRADVREVGISAVAAALGYAFQREPVDVAVVGVERAEQLEEIVDAAEVVADVGLNWERYAIEDEAFVDPSNWDV